MRTLWTDPAVEDLQSIWDYIARDSPVYATEFVGSIVSAVERLEAFPGLGRQVPEANSRDIRELIFRNYRIMYRVHKDAVQILAVIHGSRDLTEGECKPWEV